MNESAQTDSPPASGVISPFKIALIVSAVIIVLMAGISAWTWSQLPSDAKVPIHWNAKGEVDGWAGRGSLFILPAGTVGIVLLFAVIPYFEPRQGNLLRSSKAYQAVWYSMLGFFLILHGASAWAALGHALEMNAVMGVAIGLLFIVIGNYLGKVRSNYVMGIRTAWTLSSELSWNKTHRLGGRLFMILGAVMVLGGLLNPTGGSMWIIMLVGTLLLVGVSVVYSYVVWKNDPEKEKVGR